MAIYVDEYGNVSDDGRDPMEDTSQHDPQNNPGGGGVGLPGNQPPPPPANTPPPPPPANTTTQPAAVSRQDIIDYYQKTFGRAPTDAERESDYANAQKYGITALGTQQGRTFWSNIAARATNTPGGGTGDSGPYGPSFGGGSGNYPYPERVQMPDPTQPTPYGSTYQSQMADWAGGYGQADRNRIMSAILQQPETMGPTQQAQLFEQQKELLNAQRTQQLAQLQQSMAERGIRGGAYTAGQAGINQNFTSDLLAAQRDIAVKAAQQNRADQLAAIEMQNAMAQGDYGRMMQVYQANQQERANTENFLRQAAEMNQAGTLAYNQQRLAQAAAQQNEIMDFYRFLELQRQALSNYGLTGSQALINALTR